ncbi:MAG: indole-3-glycerol phosphate synthase TrpC [Eubacteriales bacterium]
MNNTTASGLSGIVERTLSTGTILDRIVAKKAERILARMEHRTIEELAEKAFASLPVTRNFARALRAQGITIIAEVKKASPSKGIIAPDFHPADQALAYERGGAAAISVLTEQDFFLGSDYHLTDVTNQVSLPVLRKDFTIDPSQIYEARILGASAILLIAALLPDKTISSYMQLADDLGLSVLLEIHTMDELMRALDFNAPIIGINNRDLHTFHVDLGVTERLAPMIPAGRTIVSESGIHTANDLSRCYRSGVQSVLIGESLMRESQSARNSGSFVNDGALGSVEQKMHDLLSEIPHQR